MRIRDLAEFLVHCGAGHYDDPLVHHGDLEDLVLPYDALQALFLQQHCGRVHLIIAFLQNLSGMMKIPVRPNVRDEWQRRADAWNGVQLRAEGARVNRSVR